MKKRKFLVKTYKFLRKILRKILLPIKIRVYNRKILSVLKNITDIKLELGSRDKKFGWTTIDVAEGADLRLNLTKKLPFKNDSISEIHSEHFFEHLSLQKIKSCLKECYRVLKIGGEISFSVPDFERACHLYCNERDFTYRRFWLLPNPNWCKCKMDELNFLIYADGYHKFMFDRENGIKRLKEAGFKNCRFREYNPGKDSERRKEQSLYFVGEKSKE